MPFFQSFVFLFLSVYSSPTENLLLWIDLLRFTLTIPIVLEFRSLFLIRNRNKLASSPLKDEKMTHFINILYFQSVSLSRWMSLVRRRPSPLTSAGPRFERRGASVL